MSDPNDTLELELPDKTNIAASQQNTATKLSDQRYSLF
jgi:hypothetical protein